MAPCVGVQTWMGAFCKVGPVFVSFVFLYMLVASSVLLPRRALASF